jgi:tetratricopeptide (TPR) repeat protein
MQVARFRIVRASWRSMLVAASLMGGLGWADQPSHLSRAQTLLAHRDDSAALVELQSLLKSEPNNLFALGNAGLICGRRGQLSLAAGYLSRAHRVKPDDLQLSLALLEVYTKSGRKQETARLAADLKAGGKLDHQQLLAAAQLLLRSGDFNSAVSLTEALPAENIERHDMLASIYTVNGDVRKASDEFQEAIRLDPSNDQRYFRLGMLYLRYRTPSLATIVFDHGVESRPDSPLLWLGLGVSQSLDEKLDLAEESLRRAIDLNPRFSDAYLLLGDILEQEKPREALDIFRHTITAHPTLPVAYYYYGRLAMQLNEGSIENTIAVLRRAVALAPNFADSYYELGRALEQDGKPDQAITQYEESLQRNPKLFTAYYRLGILYKRRGDSAKAAEAFKAFQQAQESKDPGTELKRLEYEIGRP